MVLTELVGCIDLDLVTFVTSSVVEKRLNR